MLLEKIFKRTKDYSAEAEKVRSLLNKADAIVVGIGSGLSESGGLEYENQRFVKKIFPDYHRMGYRKLSELNQMYYDISDVNAKAFWGYWARFIKAVRYEAEVGNGYRDLLRLIRNRNYFVYTTNTDGQVQKAGFEPDRVYASEGDYAQLQCKRACCDKLYESGDLLEGMIHSMGGNLEIAGNRIPRCPYCGDYLVPHIRHDASFIDTTLARMESYNNFINKYKDSKLVILELGVAPNSGMSEAFNKLIKENKEAKLIRMNNEDSPISDELKAQITTITGDLDAIVAELAVGVVSL